MDYSTINKEFILGVSSSSFQIEGAWNEDGKGESIWDRWCHTPGRSTDNGDVATDHYHKYEEDIHLLAKMGVDSYRLSISWPRIFPLGKGEPNQKGIMFYQRLVDLMVENHIRPAITLFHWDLPQALQDEGGWANPKIIHYFEEYVQCVFNALGDKVDMWITFNEPWVSTFMGYANGKFAPGIADYGTALKVAHNVLLSHGKAVRLFRDMNLQGKIGISLDFYPSKPASEKQEDILACQRDTDSHLGWFADPIYKGHYPQKLWEWYKENGVVLPVIEPGDMRIIHQPVDFLGINYYRGAVVKHRENHNWPNNIEHLNNEMEKKSKFFCIKAECLYDYLTYLHKNYPETNILITENGFSSPDFVSRNGKIEDYGRIDYIARHLEQCMRAVADGIPLQGYYVWSFMDDLEWGNCDYDLRMGLVYVDYKTLKRTMKESGHWYKQVIQRRKL